MRHIISVCLSICLTFVLLAGLSACSLTPSPEVVSPDTAPPEAVSPSPTVGSTTNSSSPIIDNLEQSPSGNSTSVLPDPLVQRLKSFLAAETGITVEAIALQQSEPVEWNNACLEVANPAEFCAEVITPGYRVTLDTPQGAYVVHTDQSGQAIRLAKSP